MSSQPRLRSQRALATAPLRRQIQNEALLFQRVERRPQIAEVFDGLHPGRPAAELADGLSAAQEQLGHHRQLDLFDAQPLVCEVANAIHSATPLHHGHRAQLAELIERFLDLRLFELHQGRAIVFLIAAGAEGVGRQRVVFRRRLGLLDKHAEDTTLDGFERPPFWRCVCGRRCGFGAHAERGRVGEWERGDKYRSGHGQLTAM